jgi:thiol-disulfide isomerase/thioredoxin
MPRLTAIAVFTLVAAAPPIGTSIAGPDDGKRPRAEQFEAIQADYQKAFAEVVGAIRAGKVRAGQDGGYAEVAALRSRFARRTREFIDAGPKDEIALDAILFAVQQLAADQDDPTLYRLILAHHLASVRLGPILDRPQAADEFLRAVAEKSPHAEIRGRARLVLAQRMARADRPRDAEAICEAILDERGLTDLHRDATALLFEIQHLSVGKVVPEIEGLDLHDKPMTLSEYRGQAVMLVFWATWCGPCMAMLPHERALAGRHAGRPFQIVGVNGDFGQEEKAIQAVRSERITWRSFRNYLIKERRQIDSQWNVHAWPTVFLIDHEGVIHRVFRGMPEEAELDGAVEKLVAAAEVARAKRDHP